MNKGYYKTEAAIELLEQVKTAILLGTPRTARNYLIDAAREMKTVRDILDEQTDRPSNV